MGDRRKGAGDAGGAESVQLTVYVAEPQVMAPHTLTITPRERL